MAKEQSLIIPVSFKIGDTEINKETLLARRDIDTKHTINGISDTQGYKEAIKLRASYRTVRTTLVKVTKELSEPHKAYIKKLKEITDELGKIAFAGEEYFDSLVTAVDEEKERIKLEKQLEDARQLSARISDLQALGCIFDGEAYYYPYTPDYAITLIDLKSYSDMEMFEYLEDVKTAFAEEQTRLHELKLAEDAAELLREQEAEEQRQLALQNQATEKALLEKRTKLRMKELTLMGFEFENAIYTHTNGNMVFLDQIAALNDDEWEELIAQADVNPGIEHNASSFIVDPAKPQIGDIYNGVPFYSEFGRIEMGTGRIIDIQPTPHDTAFSVVEPRDYSLNDFENVVKSSYKGTAKQKQLILDAVADYKETMDKF